MLRARKNPLVNALIYRLMIKPALRSAFHALYYRQAENIAESGGPCVVMANHSAWWDGHVPMLVNEEMWHLDGYVMIEDTQLVRYKFFRAMGGFSVNRYNARSALHSLSYAASILTGAPRRMLLIFPQGEIQANDVRPLTFYSGVGHIVRKVALAQGSCDVYPLALRYEFIGEQRPDAFASAGRALHFDAGHATDVHATTALMQRALTDELDRLYTDLRAYRFDGFVPLIQGRGSINRIWDAVRGKAQIKRVGGV